MRRLTVVQLLPALHSGGVERSTLEIAAALVGRIKRELAALLRRDGIARIADAVGLDAGPGAVGLDAGPGAVGPHADRDAASDLGRGA